jgi:hypothetical protein
MRLMPPPRLRLLTPCARYAARPLSADRLAAAREGEDMFAAAAALSCVDGHHVAIGKKEAAPSWRRSSATLEAVLTTAITHLYAGSDQPAKRRRTNVVVRSERLVFQRVGKKGQRRLIREALPIGLLAPHLG